MRRLPLSLLQEQFIEAVRAGTQDPERLRALGILDRGPISTQTRLAIYQTAYMLRMTEALREEFPETQRVLGEENFERFVMEYLEDFPSPTWTLAELGSKVSEFAQGARWISELPFLSDLTALEWLRAQIEHSPSREQSSIEELSRLPEADLRTMELRLSRSARLFQSPWSVHQPSIERRPCHLLVYRAPDGSVNELELTHEQWHLLGKLAGGLPIPEIVSSLSHLAPEQIKTWFSDWTSKGIIVHVRKKGGASI